MTATIRDASCTLLILAAHGCGFAEDDTPPPPPTTSVAPTTGTVPPTAPGVPAAPGLSGAYELAWVQNGQTEPRQVMPQALISTLPGCIWARWGWVFGDEGALTISNEMLCSSPPDLGVGHGVCRVEMGSAVQWRAQGFHLPVPIRASSRFTNIRRRGSATDSATARCNVSVGALDATLADIIAGDRPERPREVTLQLADGAQMRLVAIDSIEADHGAIIAARGR